MKIRYVLDRLAVTILVLLALLNAQDWLQEQFLLELKGWDMFPGGMYIGPTLALMFVAVFYQFFISQEYGHKLRDGFVLILIFGLICIDMVELALTWVGVIVSAISLFALAYLESESS